MTFDQARQAFTDAYDAYMTAQDQDGREEAIVAMLLRISDQIHIVRQERQNA